MMIVKAVVLSDEERAVFAAALPYVSVLEDADVVIGPPVRATARAMLHTLATAMEPYFQARWHGAISVLDAMYFALEEQADAPAGEREAALLRIHAARQIVLSAWHETDLIPKAA